MRIKKNVDTLGTLRWTIAHERRLIGASALMSFDRQFFWVHLVLLDSLNKYCRWKRNKPYKDTPKKNLPKNLPKNLYGHI